MHVILWFQASIRRSSSYLIGYFFRNSKLYLVDEAPNMISTLIVLLSDSDSATVAVCSASCSCIAVNHMYFAFSYIFVITGCLGSFVESSKFCSQGGTSNIY